MIVFLRCTRKTIRPLEGSIADRVAEKLGIALLDEEGKRTNRIERFVARSFYWLLMLLVVPIVFLQRNQTRSAERAA